MDPQIKKDTIRRRLMDLATARLKRQGRRGAACITLRLDSLPTVLQLTLEELGGILQEIVRESHGNITLQGGVDNGSPRVTRHFYTVKVERGAIPRAATTRATPTVVKHENFWCICLPGQSTLVPIGREGSLKGELFGVLGEDRWGKFQTTDHVREKLAQEVTHRGMQNPSDTQLLDALREINETLYDHTKLRVTRIGDLPDTIGIFLKNFLHRSPYKAVMLVYRQKLRVGIVMS